MSEVGFIPLYPVNLRVNNKSDIRNFYWARLFGRGADVNFKT